MDIVIQFSSVTKWERSQSLKAVGVSWQSRSLVWAPYACTESSNCRQSASLVRQLCRLQNRFQWVHWTSVGVFLHRRKNWIIFFLYAFCASSLVLSRIWRRRGYYELARRDHCCIRCTFRDRTWLFAHTETSPSTLWSCLPKAAATYTRRLDEWGRSSVP